MTDNPSTYAPAGIYANTSYTIEELVALIDAHRPLKPRAILYMHPETWRKLTEKIPDMEARMILRREGYEPRISIFCPRHSSKGHPIILAWGVDDAPPFGDGPEQIAPEEVTP